MENAKNFVIYERRKWMHILKEFPWLSQLCLSCSGTCLNCWWNSIPLAR